MVTRPTPVVVNVSLMGPERDYDERVTFLGRRFRIVRVGTGGIRQKALSSGTTKRIRPPKREWASAAIRFIHPAEAIEAAMSGA